MSDTNRLLDKQTIIDTLKKHPPQITSHHIRKGIRHSSYHCPIACCLSWKSFPSLMKMSKIYTPYTAMTKMKREITISLSKQPIPITDDHIINGKRNLPAHCPIANSLRMHLQTIDEKQQILKRIRVATFTTSMVCNHYKGNPTIIRFPHHSILTHAIVKYDEYGTFERNQHLFLNTNGELELC